MLICIACGDYRSTVVLGVSRGKCTEDTQGQGGGIKTELAPKVCRITSHLSPVAMVTEDCPDLTCFLSMVRCGA